MESESDETGKAPRRKLKRVVQKKRKAKADLNNSGSVMYYKKVKAALNVSLNASRLSQTLKANNRALAHSLQHVKQELRMTLNEVGRLKMENQALAMKILSLENQIGDAPQENRLKGLKEVFNTMSRCVLEMGTCINEGMDLCLAYPNELSQSSTASQPKSMEETRINDQLENQENSPSRLSLAVELKDADSEAAFPGDEWVGEFYGEDLGKMTPDMSIIMEQSVLVGSEEGLSPPEPSLSAVPEDARSISDGNNGSKLKKLSSLCQLPQRIRIGNSSQSSSNKENASSPEPRLRGRAGKTKFGSPQVRNTKNLKSTEDIDDGINCYGSQNTLPCLRRETFVLGKSRQNTLPCPRRETFIVSRSEDSIVDSAGETFSTGIVENIADIPMPELVSGSPMKEEQAKVEPDSAHLSEQNSQQADLAVTSAAKSPAEETSNQTEVIIDYNGSVPVLGSREKRKSVERRKSAGKKIGSTSTKLSKGSALITSSSVSQSKKDTEFFISNPCALNLAHKKVMGSSEGCLDADKPLEQPEPKSSLDQFMAYIRESNRNSRNLAFLMAEDLNTSLKATKTLVNASSSEMSAGASFEPELEDKTVYFDSEMEFTEVLPQSLSLNAFKEAAEKIQGEETKDQPTDRQKEVDQETASNKSKQKAKAGNVQTAKTDGVDVSGDKADSGSDKKLAVAMLVNKPGQMVFAASRKEDDGSRKAIPNKLQTKSRSKSKKKMEELVKNLPQKEPECVFDFHDKTPRPATADGKASQHHDSIFDLSLNDTVPGACSLASLRDKLKAKNNNTLVTLSGSQEKNETVLASKGNSASSLLGDAPVYSVPLKDDSTEPEPRPRSRGRSQSKNNDRGRQSRSRSRSGTGEEKSETARRSARSRSRTHLKYTEDDASDDDFISPTANPKEKKVAQGRSCSRVKKDDGDYKPPRSQPRGRSRPRQTVDQPAENVTSPSSDHKKQNVTLGRNCSKVKKGDADYNNENGSPSWSEPKGESIPKQTDQPTEKDYSSPTVSPKALVTPSGLQEKIETELAIKGKAASSLLGDAPVYSVPLKDDSTEPEPRPRSRGRSQSKNKDRDRQSRSRSRSGTEEEKSETARRSARSRSRTHLKYTEDDVSKDDFISPTANPKEKKIDQGRSCSRAKKDDGDYKPPRSQPRGRSRPRQTIDHPTQKVTSPTSGHKEQIVTQGRNCNKVRKGDADDNYENRSPSRSEPMEGCIPRQTDQPTEKDYSSPTATPKEKTFALGRSHRVTKCDGDSKLGRSQSRGRSRHRQTDNQPTEKENNVTSPISSLKEETIVQGRSCSMVRNDDDNIDKLSGRSQMRGRSCQGQADDQPRENAITTPASSPKEKEVAQGSSHSRVSSGDNTDNNPSGKSQMRERSRQRQTEDQPTETENKVTSPISSPKEKTIVQGRSRSRVGKDVDDDNIHKARSRSQIRGRTDDHHTKNDTKQGKPLQHKVRSKQMVFGDESSKEKELPISSALAGQNIVEESHSVSAGHQTNSGSNEQSGQEDAEDKLSNETEDCLEDAFPKGSPLQPFVSARRDRNSEKRKTRVHAESEKDVSPSKKLCREKKSIGNSEKVDTSVETSESAEDKRISEKQKACSKENSCTPLFPSLPKRRKSSLPVAMPHAREEDGKTWESPALAKTRNISVSKLPEATRLAEKVEKDKHQLDFEVLKQKLEELNSAECSSVDSVPCVKKSRPLVLPVQSETASNSKTTSAKSLPGNDREVNNKKATAGFKKGKSQPGSPKTNKSAAKLPATSAKSSAASPQSRDQHNSDCDFEVLEESAQSDGRRAGRRAAASVCYKEPSLNVKLRRGDPHTSALHKDDLKHIYKSPRSHKKRDTLENMKRTALNDLTNVNAE